MKNLITHYARYLVLGLVVGGLYAGSAHAAETYDFDPSHTMVNWQANHFGFSNPTGKFPFVTGHFTLDEKNPAASKVEATIDLAKISSGDEKFDTHLKSADFFNIEKYKTAKFVSNKVEVIGKNTAKVYGALTLLDKTNPVVLDVTLNKIGENPMSKKKTSGFTALTTIKRSDYGITYAIPGVSDEVKLHIEAEGTLRQ
jgi:polyisoprenoid-binding protein YceI